MSLWNLNLPRLKRHVLDVDGSFAEDSLVQAMFHRPPDAGTCLAGATWLPRVREDVHIHLLEVYVQLISIRHINITSTISYLFVMDLNFRAVDL